MRNTLAAATLLLALAPPGLAQQPAKSPTLAEALEGIPEATLPAGRAWGFLDIQDANAYLAKNVSGRKVTLRLLPGVVFSDGKSIVLAPKPNPGHPILPRDKITFRGNVFTISAEPISVRLPLSDKDKLRQVKEGDPVIVAVKLGQVGFRGQEISITYSSVLGDAELVEVPAQKR